MKTKLFKRYSNKCALFNNFRFYCFLYRSIVIASGLNLPAPKNFKEKFKTAQTGTITFVTKRKLTNKGEQICQVLVI